MASFSPLVLDGNIHLPLCEHFHHSTSIVLVPGSRYSTTIAACNEAAVVPHEQWQAHTHSSFPVISLHTNNAADVALDTINITLFLCSCFALHQCGRPFLATVSLNAKFSLLIQNGDTNFALVRSMVDSLRR